MNNQKQKKSLNKYAKLSSLAFQMFAIIGFGSFIGVKLDEYYPNQHDLYTLILSLSSVLISIYYVIKQIILSSKDK